MLSSDLQKLSVTGLVTLYELDATKLGAGIMRWHGHVSHEDWRLIFGYLDKTKYFDAQGSFNAIDEKQDLVKRDIIWQGQIYSPIPIQTDGLEMRGDGKASMPSLALANNLNGIQGAISALCLRHDDFAGARLTVINTMAKYLDAANFTHGNPQAANEYRKQLWYVEAKTSENASAITFELSNPIDMEGARIPSREITSFCHWGINNRYRGSECQYMGTARFTEDGTPTDDAALDKCGSRLSDCRLRNNEARFGGFPSSSLVSG